MAGERNLVVTHSSPLRTVRDEEVWEAIEAMGQRGLTETVAIDTSDLGDRDGANWSAAQVTLWHAAADIVRRANERGGRIQYFGMDHVPCVIALGAYVGDERRVDTYDHHRDLGTWTWPAAEQTIELEEPDLPRDVVRQPGPVVVRVEVSGTISDEDVREALSGPPSAEVRIRVKAEVREFGIVRSPQDVEAIRLAFRRVLAVLREKRPEAEEIHLFIFAPCSVCFAVGQELHLRSSPPIQTYQYRALQEEPGYTPAIRLTAAAPQAARPELTDLQRDRARHIRTVIMPRALRVIVNDALSRKDVALAAGEGTGAWYEHLLPPLVRDARPFPELPSLWELVSDADQVSADPLPESYEEAYGFVEKHREWRFQDALLIGFDVACGGDDHRLEELARLFFCHEYLHDWQNLTKETAENVGSFANCLERIDYMADAYAILHQLHYVTQTDRQRVGDDNAKIRFLREQIELAIRSFWAFDTAGEPLWQERRIRRYLNWFWRHVQILNAPKWADLLTCFRLLARPPAIEITGLEYHTDRRRIRVHLEKVRRGENLEIGVVLEDGRFLRMSSVGNVSLEALTKAFVDTDHEAIERFFSGFFDYARATGATYPRA